MSEIAELAGRAATGGGQGRRPERALVLVPITRTDGASGREREARIAEASGLARAIDLTVVDCLAISLGERRPATLLGSGKVAEIAARVDADHLGLVIFDGVLAPVQQRNLERAWNVKVIDRTGLILEIFGARARTREGRLQVELAHLNYQRTRLVRSWTHLERQRGGYGFLGGPGETQIETDRRLIGERIARIEKDLKTVATRRRLQRATRKTGAEALVALVGYTNAGKSRLFNALTAARVLADDRLFATLDPTLRRIELPHGATAVLSDTVGFVADLPTTLIAAFRATLEEVAEADIILNVRDIAHPDSEAQGMDVRAVLAELAIDARAPGRVIEVWNKIDLLTGAQRPPRLIPARVNGEGTAPAVVAVSALTGEGLTELLDMIEQHISSGRPVYEVALSGDALGKLHLLYKIGEVLARTDAPDGATIARVRVRADRDTQFRRSFPDASKVV